MGRTKKIAVITLSIALVVAVAAIAGAQMLHRQGGFRHCGRFGITQRMAARLNLTAAQKTQALGIFQQAKKDALAVFTPAQRDQMAQMRKQWRGQQGRRGQMRQQRRGQRGQFGQALNLTPEQKDKMKAIRQDASAQIDAVRKDAKLSQQDRIAKIRAIRQSVMEQTKQVLTPEQRQKLQQAIGQRMQRGPFQRLKLTADQQAQIKSIREKALAQFRGILTPDQQKQLDQTRRQMQQRMQQFRQQHQQPEQGQQPEQAPPAK